MNAVKIPTEFAPAERIPLDIVYNQSESIKSIPIIPELLNTMLNFVLILNKHRQIVFATENFLQFTIEKDIKKILGLRPGEALGCVHSFETDGGCGTTKFCAECGAVKSILNSTSGFKDLQECRITRVISGKPEALDLLVYTSPFNHIAEQFIVVSVIDISHLKRRRTLENIFYHDMLNAIGGLHSLIEQILEEAPVQLHKELEIALNGVHDIIEQIQMHRELTSAENNELKLQPFPIHINDLFQIVISQLKHQSISRQRSITIDNISKNTLILTDPSLLKRVLLNLVKNALESIGLNKTVTIGSIEEDKSVTIYIHNPAFIPERIQLQIFNRSFSTKGQGRGLGTYSAKLLTEGYLQGKVWFESTEEKGTTFYIKLPKHIDLDEEFFSSINE